MRTTVIYHRADYDGLFSAAVCAKFLPDAELIGWDFGDALIPQPEGITYIVDLPPDCLKSVHVPDNIIWIDHHKSSISKWDDQLGSPLRGYRIDGVAACRLCWAWFLEASSGKVESAYTLPTATEFVHRAVSEPLALTLAGEYDVWDKRDARVDPFQFGLTANRETLESLRLMLDLNEPNHSTHVAQIVGMGGQCRSWQQVFAEGICKTRSYLRTWEGVSFCVIGSAHAVNSLWMPESALPEGTQALMKWHYDGTRVSFSLYHAPGHEEHDLSTIAVKYGGGGHRGACGFAMSLDEALEIIR